MVFFPLFITVLPVVAFEQLIFFETESHYTVLAIQVRLASGFQHSPASAPEYSNRQPVSPHLSNESVQFASISFLGSFHT